MSTSPESHLNQVVRDVQAQQQQQQSKDFPRWAFVIPILGFMLVASLCAICAFMRARTFRKRTAPLKPLLLTHNRKATKPFADSSATLVEKPPVPSSPLNAYLLSPYFGLGMEAIAAPPPAYTAPHDNAPPGAEDTLLSTPRRGAPGDPDTPEVGSVDSSPLASNRRRGLQVFESKRRRERDVPGPSREADDDMQDVVLTPEESHDGSQC